MIIAQTAFSPCFTIEASASTYEKIKEAASDAGSAAKKKTESAAEAAKKATEEAEKKAKQAAEDAGNVAKKAADSASKATKEASEKAGKATQEAADKAGKAAKEGSQKAKEKASEAGTVISDKAGKAYVSASSTAKSISDNVTNYITNIDTEKFKAGWEYASKYTGTTIASLKGSAYVNSVQKQIDNTAKEMQRHLKETVDTKRTVQQDAGFAAEIWHADSFNLDAALNGSEFEATVPNSREKASADVIVSGKDYSQDYSMKYYKDAESSAKEQAKTFYQDYCEEVASDQRNGKTPLTAEEYLDKYDKSIDSLYDSLYAGQGKIIPDDQLAKAKTYLKNKKNKIDVSDNIERQKFSPELQETLDTLASRIEAPDGTKSSPLTEDQAKALVELTREDKDLKLSDFNVTPSQLITTKYILKQAVNAGTQSAIISTAFAIGPDVYTIIVDAAKEGKIDEKELKETGIEGILSGTEGFVEGSVSSAIVIACQSGKFGNAYTNIAPETVGTLTVLTIDAIRFGYQLSTGQITEADYADLMTQDIIIAIASQTSGTLVQALFPFIPFAYVAGSMAGAMLASVGYTTGKELILEVRGENGFETVVPEAFASGKSLATSFMSNITLKDKLSDFKGMAVSTIGNGKLKIKTKVG
ncbi:hypothetical protein [Butyrivibrio proteoclasticus]|uniref:hypothetical protein n=1 Tax=Butyrivibrio proteoclasticus TaxID=43305 RepID=UPI000686542D|nr:hypothetical protein [Butyrivibrio proteoclasticus]